MKDILVTKYGSGTLTNGGGVNYEAIDSYAEKLRRLQDQFDLIVVTSGAVAAGHCIWQASALAATADHEPSLQSLASIGSPHIFTAWQKACERHGMLAGTVSVTHREIDDTSEGPMLLKSLHENRASGLVTILNENDVVSDEELARLAYGGENDGLAFHVARAVGAKSLILCTKKGGIFDNVGEEIARIDQADFAKTLEMAQSRTPGKRGRGGLYTKVKALIDAAEVGIEAYVAKASDDIPTVLAGAAGTHFVAQKPAA